MSDVFGKFIGRYTLLEQLGEGGMAKVYNAYDPRMERNVAIKVILPSHQSSTIFLERFALEAKSLAQLSHTNIVKVLDYGEENGQPYLVMDYIGGGTLKDYLDAPIPWKTAAAFLAPIARALDYVHKQKIVHRDVKPSNILIDQMNQPMLSDFGVVKLLEEEEVDVAATGVGIGTPDYMSPEQGTGKEADFRADIYALGVVFFEMVLGQKPYSADTPMAVVIKHVTDEFPRPRMIDRQLPDYVEHVILKAVQKDPLLRYNSIAEFAEALEELAKGEVAADKKKIKKLTSLVKKVNLRAIRMTVGLLIVVALLAGVALSWNRLANWVNPGVVLQNTADAPIVAVGSVTETPTPELLPTETPQGLVAIPTYTPMPTLVSTPDAPVVASNQFVSNEGSVSLVDSPVIVSGSNQEIARWGIGGANTVSWRHDGQSILLGTTSGGFVYSVPSLNPQAFLDVKSWVQNAVYSLDDKTIFVTSRYGLVQGFDAITGQVQQTYAYIKPVGERLAKDVNLQAMALAQNNTGKNLAVGYANGAINVWDLERNEKVMVVDQYPTVTGLVFSSDSRYLYSISGDNDITIWDVASGKKEKTLQNPTPITHMVISKDGNYILAGGEAAAVYLWDTLNERLLHTFYALKAPVSSLAISPDGKQLAFGLTDGTIRVFGMLSEKELGNAQKEIYVVKAHSDGVTGLDFSPDGAQLASTSWRDGLKIWDGKTGNPTKALDKSFPQIARMQFSPDGKWLAVANVDLNVQLWDVYSGKMVFQSKGYLPGGDVFSPNSDLLVVAQDGANTWDTGQLLIDQVPSGNTIQTLKGYKIGWRIFFNKQQSLMTAGIPQEAMIWDISTWEKLNTHGGPNSGCGQFYTPESKVLTVLSDIGAYETLDKKVEGMCGSKPQLITLEYYFHENNVGVYAVIGGILFEDDPLTVNTGWLKTDVTIRLHKDHFVAAQRSSRLYAYIRDDADLYFKFTGSRQPFFQLPWQKDWQYQVEFSPRDNLVALGTKYGSIHFYVLTK